MRPGQICLGFLWSAVTLSALPEAQEQPFVSARTKRPVVAFGSSVVVNCSTTCQHPTSGNLETNLEKEEVGNGSTWRAFRLLNVSDWDLTPSCYFHCTDARGMKPRGVNFIVYRLPKLVELDPVPVVDVGESYTLTCRVSNVAPIRNLSVSFLKGGEKLHTQTFENHAERKAGDVVANHTVTAQRAVYGENVSCQAVVDLWPEGPVFGKTSLNRTLNITNATGIMVAVASIAMLAIVLVVTGICASCPRTR